MAYRLVINLAGCRLCIRGRQVEKSALLETSLISRSATPTTQSNSAILNALLVVAVQVSSWLDERVGHNRLIVDFPANFCRRDIDLLGFRLPSLSHACCYVFASRFAPFWPFKNGGQEEASHQRD